MRPVMPARCARPSGGMVTNGGPCGSARGLRRQHWTARRAGVNRAVAARTGIAPVRRLPIVRVAPCREGPIRNRCRRSQAFHRLEGCRIQTRQVVPAALIPSTRNFRLLLHRFRFVLHASLMPSTRFAKACSMNEIVVRVLQSSARRCAGGCAQEALACLILSVEQRLGESAVLQSRACS